MDRIVTSTNDDGVNKIYMRYAEVLLMAAEIENELTGPVRGCSLPETDPAEGFCSGRLANQGRRLC